MNLGTPFSHEALSPTMIMWRKTATNISNCVFFFFFVLFPLCLNVHHPPYKAPLARSDCFKLVACSQEIRVWRSSTRESTGGG